MTSRVEYDKLVVGGCLGYPEVPQLRGPGEEVGHDDSSTDG
jgi:hypothetical protein